MTSWHSYPKLFAMGHRAIADILADDVLVQEKVDGSQFSFGLFGDADDPDAEPLLRVRSKGAEMIVDAPEKMFNKIVEVVKDLARRGQLRPNWTYRGEYLAKPKHNTLAYDRHPKNFLALFDINTGEEAYAGHELVKQEADRLGFDVVPTLYWGRVETLDQFRAFLERESFLGGQKIEGVVVKNYARFGTDKKVLMGKFVSEAFKEAHTGAWKEANPGKQDIVDKLISGLATPARWSKAVQHLRERGALTDSPKDIGPLLKEIGTDVHAECADEIRDALFKWAWPSIQRGIIRGFPEWYKEELLKKQFEREAA